MLLTIYTDGGARSNPGPAGIGIVAVVGQTVVYQHGETIGVATNNVAEYSALLYSVEWVTEYINAHPEVSSIVWKLDSKLVVEQVQKHWKIKEPTLQQLAQEVWQKLTTIIIPHSFTHIPREQNKHADMLVNQALDAQV